MNARRLRRGFTIVELCVTCALLGAAIPLTVSTLGAVARQRRAAETRQAAIEAADNLLERLSAASFEELTSETLAGAERGLPAGEWLPGGQIKLQLTESPGPVAAKRIDVELSWQPQAGASRDRVRLSGWVYRKAAPR
ncbi:MAG TPA: type II secretion system protein [Pirellulales bacterium]|nr:type II secretion system protein [Pirellulales bacterium]